MKSSTEIKTEKRSILVTGGTGYIGSHMVTLLKKSGYTPIVLDKLADSKESKNAVRCYQGDVGDKELIRQIHKETQFSAVIHFAAYIKVGESVTDPLKYYESNVAASIHFFSTLKELGIKDIVFSSSAAVYGSPNTEEKITEDASKNPINPYGKTKAQVEEILKDWCTSDANVKVIALRYFNVAGADPTVVWSGVNSPPANLIPIVLQKALRKETVEIFGSDYDTPDGSGIRDYIHVVDLCSAHLKSLEALQKSAVKGFEVLNLGTGKGYSVKEVIETAKAVTGLEIATKVVDRRQGDPGYLVADGSRANKLLEWKPTQSDLKTIIQDAWKLIFNNQQRQTETAAQKQKKQMVAKYSFFTATAFTASAIALGIITRKP